MQAIHSAFIGMYHLLFVGCGGRSTTLLRVASHLLRTLGVSTFKRS
jgi:hypothetical protein